MACLPQNFDCLTFCVVALRIYLKPCFFLHTLSKPRRIFLWLIARARLQSHTARTPIGIIRGQKNVKIQKNKYLSHCK